MNTQRLLQVLLAISSFVFFAGCLSHGALRDQNRANLMRIEVGMTKEQLLEIMGEKTATAIDGKVSNPYKREIVRASDGGSYEVLYYYTEYYVPSASLDTILTPIVLRDRKIVGWGWSFFEDLGLKQSVTIRQR